MVDAIQVIRLVEKFVWNFHANIEHQISSIDNCRRAQCSNGEHRFRCEKLEEIFQRLIERDDFTDWHANILLPQPLQITNRVLFLVRIQRCQKRCQQFQPRIDERSPFFTHFGRLQQFFHLQVKEIGMIQFLRSLQLVDFIDIGHSMQFLFQFKFFRLTTVGYTIRVCLCSHRRRCCLALGTFLQFTISILMRWRLILCHLPIWIQHNFISVFVWNALKSNSALCRTCLLYQSQIKDIYKHAVAIKCDSTSRMMDL